MSRKDNFKEEISIDLWDPSLSAQDYIQRTLTTSGREEREGVVREAKQALNSLDWNFYWNTVKDHF